MLNKIICSELAQHIVCAQENYTGKKLKKIRLAIKEKEKGSWERLLECWEMCSLRDVSESNEQPHILDQ